MKKGIFILAFIFINGIFFHPFFLQQKLPIPADNIVGLYHPFRDLYSDRYSNGVPFKNFLITDPVRQQYPWKSLSIEIIKNFQLPLWNPYSLSGTPLLANIQSAPFYPLNFLFFIAPFDLAWSIFIILQPFLAGIFIYLYLNNLKLDKKSSFIGALAFSFSGFSVSWLEWGNIVHTGLWLPLILLSIDKILLRNKNKNLLFWCFVFVFSLVSSFFAGHLQTFFYIFTFSAVYLAIRIYMSKKVKRSILLFAICYLLFAIITLIQWLSALELISHSARAVDQVWEKDGWFLPIQNLIQFIVPDFFGNPATLNYWGVWNYAEFVGFVGITPIVLAAFAVIARKDKKTLFFSLAFVGSILFALENIVSRLPYQFEIPLISSAQPTRLLFISTFSLSVLSALGFDYLLKTKNNKQLGIVLLAFFVVFLGLWYFVFLGYKSFPDFTFENIGVAKRNIILPFLFFCLTAASLLMFCFFKNKKVMIVLSVLIIIFSTIDLYRFVQKFTPFTNSEYIFPSTRTTSFLQSKKGIFRIMSLDDRILPPNFSIIYKIQSVDGYDPLYLQRYGELIVASERRKSDINSPFGFNRIITPKNFDSKIIDLLGVRYVLSLSDLNSQKLNKVYQEGETRIYENKEMLPRVFLVEKVVPANNKKDAIDLLFNVDNYLKKAVVEGWNESNTNFASGSAKVISYKENEVMIEKNNNQESFLVLTDSFYPIWKAKVCDKDLYCKAAKIYRTDYNFRGVIVPSDSRTIIFYNSLL